LSLYLLQNIFGYLNKHIFQTLKLTVTLFSNEIQMTLESARLLFSFAYSFVYFSLKSLHSPLYNLFYFAFIIKSLELASWKLVITAYYMVIFKFVFG